MYMYKSNTKTDYEQGRLNRVDRVDGWEFMYMV